MATIYSTRFVAGSFANGATLYTVPASNVAVIRTVTMVILTSGAAGGLVISGPGSFITHQVASTAGQCFIDNMRQVLNAADVLLASSSSGNIVLTVSGYLLSA